jgi:hypothetical protein
MPLAAEIVAIAAFMGLPTKLCWGNIGRLAQSMAFFTMPGKA